MSVNENLNDCNENKTEDIDEDLVLSEQALNALKQFYDERQQNINLINDSIQQINGQIEENWQLSQFWYSEDTAHYLSDQVIHAIDGLPKDESKPKSIACISCPTLFAKLFQKLNISENNSINLYLLEFDPRFENKYPLNFVFYDYNEPVSHLIEQKFSPHSFDVVIADPPFLSEECLKKVIQTIKYLTKDKILVCSGAVMRDLLQEYLQLEQCEHFVPKHERNLGNEFKCFSNFPLKLCSHKSE